MFGVVRPCRHRLRGPLFGQWMAHLCGLCLTVRDLHGQHARLVTNYDGLLVSVLTEAQNPAVTPHRTAGPCALRGLRRADVADAAGAGARLAASVSLVLAAGKLRDHVADGDGTCARRLIASGAAALAARWQAAGERTGAGIGFDTAVLTDAIGRQAEIENAPGLSLLEVTEPTETAVSAAFAPHGRARRPATQRRAAGRRRPELRPARAPARCRRGPASRPVSGRVQPAAGDRDEPGSRPPALRRGAGWPARRGRRARTQGAGACRVAAGARGRRCRRPGLHRAGWRAGRAARVRWPAVPAGAQIPVQAAGLRTWAEAARPVRRLLLGWPLRRLLLRLLLRRVL